MFWWAGRWTSHLGRSNCRKSWTALRMKKSLSLTQSLLLHSLLKERPLLIFLARWINNLNSHSFWARKSYSFQKDWSMLTTIRPRKIEFIPTELARSRAASKRKVQGQSIQIRSYLPISRRSRWLICTKLIWLQIKPKVHRTTKQIK